jgi:ATP-dependent DNA helicase PIF1
VLMSADSVVLEAGVDTDFQPYPVEFLNSLKTSGLPLAQLTLKIGCPLMLLRNLDPINGLCNGTCMILVNIQPRVLECHIMGGKHKGHIAFIPRISLEPSNEDLPIKLRRAQFSVCLAFAMTVNKLQGQSVQHVGLDLQTPVFTHGQLYVALSRCTSGEHIKVLFPEGQRTTSTVNIVYPKVLTGVL